MLATPRVLNESIAVNFTCPPSLVCLDMRTTESREGVWLNLVGTSKGHTSHLGGQPTYWWVFLSGLATPEFGDLD